ncbi:hypothetical protein GEMRC1_002803 [Eukaryota sp. GEM-RC1]
MEGGFHSLVESLLWVFCYLGDVFEQSYPYYLTKELTFAIGALIHDSNAIISNAALRFIGNVFSDCCPFITEMVDDLDLITKILDPSGPLKKRKEVLWIFSNILAESAECVNFCFNKGLIPIIIKYLTHDDHSLFMESGWCVLNTVDLCSYEQLMILAQKSVFGAIIKGLSRPNIRAVEHSIEILSIFARRLVEVREPVPKELPILKALFKTAKVMENVKEIADGDDIYYNIRNAADEFLVEFASLA